MPARSETASSRVVVRARRHRVGLLASGAALVLTALGSGGTAAASGSQVPITVPGWVGGSTTTSTSPPPAEEPAPGDGDSLPESVPVSDATVPPPPLGASGPAVDGRAAAGALRRELRVAQADLVERRGSYESVRSEVLAVQSRVDDLEERLTTMSGDQRSAVRRVEAARRRFEVRAAEALIRGDLDEVLAATAATDPNDLGSAQVLLSSVLDADRDSLSDYRAARASLDRRLGQVADELMAARAELTSSRARLVEARRSSAQAFFDVAVLAAGSEIVIRGFTFPVADPHTFGDSFGAPRMTGTGYAHAHQGTDIMAPAGTPLLACERGVVTRMGSDVLGGTKLWLKGQSGTYYYYAHLSAYAPGLGEGMIVEPGTMVGLVGDTGNARGGAPHLHFEIHPDGGPAVNPYPLLRVVDQLDSGT